MNDSDDEFGYPLSPESFVKKVDSEIKSLADHILSTGAGSFEEYKELRGKYLSCVKLKKVFLNK